MYQQSNEELEGELADMLKSVSASDGMLQSIVETESEIIRRARRDCRSLEEFMAVNESVNGVIKNIIKLQMLLQSKQDAIDEKLKGLERGRMHDEQEE